MAFVMASDIPLRAKKFWVQVLRRAVFDYVLYNGKASKRRQWQSAFNYIFSEDQQYEDLETGEPAFGFEEVCGLFGWDPDYIRRLTTQLTRADIKRMEMSSFEGEFGQDVLAVFVRESCKWKTSRFALPFYPRMIDEFTPTPQVDVVQKHVLSKRVPMVQWRAAG